jgi:basic membrane lipoprotein Med (substrate-binding protein (PBP1-ABC) superfamily)
MKGTKRNGITALVGGLIVIVILLAAVAAYAFLYPPSSSGTTVTNTVTSTVTASGAQASKISALKVGLIEPITPADNSWNYQAHEELAKLQTYYGFTFSEQDNIVSGTDAQPIASQWAASGYNVIFLQGIQYQTMASTAAHQYPNTLFVCVDCLAANYSNVYRIWLDISGGGFVLGAMAGMLSSTHKFGLIGGGFVPSIWGGHEGFIAGVLYTTSATPTFFNKFEAFAWSDSAGAKTDATSDYTNGADTVFSSGDGIDVGVLGAAMSQSGQVWATNVYSNLTAVVPADNKVLLGSIVVNWATLYNKALIDFVTGNWQWGFSTANMASGVVQVNPGPNVPSNIRAAGLALQADIVTGSISTYYKTDSNGNPHCFNQAQAKTSDPTCADSTLTVPTGGGTPTGNTAMQFSYLPAVSSLP